MKRLLVLAVLSLGLLTACGDDVADVSESGEGFDAVKQEVAEKEERTALGLKKEFENKGFEVGDNESIMYQMLHADTGIKFELDGELIEIYEYDLDNLSEEAEDIVGQAEQGSVDMSGINIPVKYKDGLMIVRHNDHSKESEIVEVFEAY